VLDIIFLDTLACAHEWEQKATERRAISQADPVADTLLFCAKQLRATVQELEHGAAYLTPEQYGSLCSPPVTAQTVTRWIRTGQLRGTDTPTGWMVRRDAKRMRQSA
jgi:hypothetical protein